jgi:putative beta-barrel porin BBP2
MFRSHARTVALFIAIGLLVPSEGFGQAKFRLPNLREDRGVNVGDFKIWPEFFVETRYDSNLFRGSDDDREANGDVSAKASALIYRAIPAVEIRKDANRIYGLHVQAKGDFRKYQGNGDTAEMVEAQQAIGGNARGRIDLFPMSIFRLYLQDSFRRALQTRSLVSKDTFTRLYNEVGAGLVVAPSSALTFDLGYRLARDTFEEMAVSDKSSHKFALRTRWRFFPKTSAFLTAGAELIDYDNALVDTAGTVYGNYSSTPVRALGGLTGFVTRRIFVTLAGGFGMSMHEAGSNYSNFLAQALLGYQFNDTFIIQGGYERKFDDSVFANFYSTDNMKIATQVRLWQLVDLDLEARYALVGYGDAPITADSTPSHVSRADALVAVQSMLSMNFARYIGANVGVSYTNLMSDYRSTSPLGRIDYGAFNKLEVFANVVVRY